MKKLLINITIHPIDRVLLESLNLYDNSTLEKNYKLPGTIRKLLENGYTNFNHCTFDKTRSMLKIHITQEIDQNGVYIK